MKYSFISVIILTLLTSFHSIKSYAQNINHDASSPASVRIGAYISVVTNVFENQRGGNAENIFPLQKLGFPTGVNFWMSD